MTTLYKKRSFWSAVIRHVQPCSLTFLHKLNAKPEGGKATRQVTYSYHFSNKNLSSVKM